MCGCQLTDDPHSLLQCATGSVCAGLISVCLPACACGFAGIDEDFDSARRRRMGEETTDDEDDTQVRSAGAGRCTLDRLQCLLARPTAATVRKPLACGPAVSGTACGVLQHSLI
jgi:hypothetical protein